MGRVSAGIRKCSAFWPPVLVCCHCGAWSPHIAIVGAHRGQQVCEQWSVLGRSDGWARCSRWWHPLTRNLAQELAPTVIEQVREEGSAVRYGITWYTEARRLENSVETPLILAQAGLELMAWDVGVRRKAAFSPLGFDRLRAEGSASLLVLPHASRTPRGTSVR